VIADRRLDWEGRATWTFLGSLEELRPARGRQLWEPKIGPRRPRENCQGGWWWSHRGGHDPLAGHSCERMFAWQTRDGLLRCDPKPL